jgi:hypothetical protein
MLNFGHLTRVRQNVSVQLFYITKTDTQPYDFPTLINSRRVSNGSEPNLYYDPIIQRAARIVNMKH